MERNRNKKAKSLRAAGGKNSVKQLINESQESRLVPGPEFPPVRNFAKKDIQVRRFIQNAAVTNQAFTLANGHDQFLVVTNVAGNAVPYVDSWRIKRIDVWCISEANFSTNVTISAVGTDLTSNMRNDPERIWQCTSRSVSDPGHMSIVPSKNLPLGSWHFTSTTNFAGSLFQMSVGGGGGVSNFRCTMDITFETLINYVGLPLGYGVVTSTTTLGTVGGRGILSGFILQGINNLG